MSLKEFPKDDLTATLACLLRVRERLDTDDGICHNAQAVYYRLWSVSDPCIRGVRWVEVSRVNKCLFALWPKFSGDLIYPVPSGISLISAEEAFDDCPPGRFWDRRTVYGRNRHELLNFMIEQLEMEIAKRDT